MEILLATGHVDADSRSSYNKTPLMKATGKGHCEIVQMLIVNYGVYPNTEDEFTNTAISLATDNGHLKVLVPPLGSNRLGVPRLSELAGAVTWLRELGELANLGRYFLVVSTLPLAGYKVPCHGHRVCAPHHFDTSK